MKRPADRSLPNLYSLRIELVCGRRDHRRMPYDAGDNILAYVESGEERRA